MIIIKILKQKGKRKGMVPGAPTPALLLSSVSFTISETNSVFAYCLTSPAQSSHCTPCLAGPMVVA